MEAKTLRWVRWAVVAGLILATIPLLVLQHHQSQERIIWGEARQVLTSLWHKFDHYDGESPVTPGYDHIQAGTGLAPEVGMTLDAFGPIIAYDVANVANSHYFPPGSYRLTAVGRDHYTVEVSSPRLPEGGTMILTSDGEITRRE